MSIGFRLLRVLTIACIALVFVKLSHGEEEYVVRGPAETAAFEKGLRELDRSYVFGIFPRDGMLTNGVNGSSIEKRYIGHVEN